MQKLIFFMLWLISFSAFSADKLKVYWDCNLDGDPVSCIELNQAYFEDTSLEIATSANAADLRLVLRFYTLNNEVEYKVTTKWQNGADLSYPGFPLNATLSASERLEKVLSFLKDVTKTYITIISNGTANPSTEADKPFYMVPSASGSGGKQQGSTNFNGSVQLMGNYSVPKWRLWGATYGGINYFSSQKTAFNPGITTQINYYGASGAVVRSLPAISFPKKGQWDVALFVNDRTVINDIKFDGDIGELPENSLHNKARKSSMRAGIEWIAVPFLTDKTTGNFAVRYSLTAEHHKYVDPESFQYVQETFARHLVEVYFAEHYKKVDIGLGVGAFASTFREKPLQGLNGFGEVKFKINPRTTIGATASVQYAKNRVLNPAEGTMSFSGLTSVGSPLTYTGSLTLSYTLGSIRIFNKEQRWKD